VSETGADVAIIAGRVLVSGSLTAIEVGSDTANISGVVVPFESVLLNVFTSSGWVQGSLRTWDGAEWVKPNLKRWTGSQWETQ
jgi:hypothetical protein